MVFILILMNLLCLKESSLFLKKYLLNKKNLKFSKKLKIPNQIYNYSLQV